jgi:hypothetical protein
MEIALAITARAGRITRAALRLDALHQAQTAVCRLPPTLARNCRQSLALSADFRSPSGERIVVHVAGSPNATRRL